MKPYKTCREIPIHNFFEISRIGDLRYLHKNYDDLEPIEEDEELESIYIDIIDEYNSLFQNKTNYSLLDKAELVRLKLQIIQIELVCEIAFQTEVSPIIDVLSQKIGIPFKDVEIYKKTILSQINKIENQQNKDSETDENESDNLEKTLTLVKENGFNFDRYRTPIIELIFAINRLEEKSKYLESLKNKR